MEPKRCPRCGALHNYPAALCLMCERHQAVVDDTYRAFDGFKQRLDAADARREQAERDEERRRKAAENGN